MTSLTDPSDNCIPSWINTVSSWITLISDTSLIKALGQLWAIGRKLLRGLSSEGMYEVVDYQTTLEIKDEHGRYAILKKLEKVRYLQNNIIAFQDQAWGDGKILVKYNCTPGVAVDQYRCGNKTFILISLRQVKFKGDMDQFKIEWGIEQGFLKKDGFWATEISHRTQQIKIRAIFPKCRSPRRIAIIERNSQKTHLLGQTAKKQLSDGRWLVTWKSHQPRLYEQYIFHWEW